MTDNVDIIQGAVKELRETFELATKKADVLHQEKINKINEELDKQEKKNQDLVKQVAAQEKAMRDAEEKMLNLEKSLSAMPSGAAKDMKPVDQELKFLGDFLLSGAKSDSIRELEQKYLRTDKLEDGGALVGTAIDTMIIKNLTEVDPIRVNAKTRTAPIGKTEMLIRTGLVTVAREGEAVETSSSNSTYGKRYLKLNRYTTNVPVTVEELSGAVVNLESEILADYVEALAEAQGYDFILGNNVNRPEGFMVNSEISALEVSGGVVTLDSIISLAGQLKSGYKARSKYFMNGGTITALRLKKDTTNQYLWQVGNIAAGIPNQINGYTYVECPSFDDYNTVNGYPVAFGDLYTAYLIGDAMGTSVIRDVYSRKKEAMVEFTFLNYTGGITVKPEALKKLKVTS